MLSVFDMLVALEVAVVGVIVVSGVVVALAIVEDDVGEVVGVEAMNICQKSRSNE